MTREEASKIALELRNEGFYLREIGPKLKKSGYITKFGTGGSTEHIRHLVSAAKRGKYRPRGPRNKPLKLNESFGSLRLQNDMVMVVIGKPSQVESLLRSLK